ncbi:DUF3800 domain-containing protein [Nostoc sp. CHAB 5824]|nr:DUF3800 domain-containing protein [Nostoc sp. CHAB 5824]
MGFFYFDESIHENYGFILGAFVYTHDDMQCELEQILTEHGFVPGRDEFKSSAHMGRHPEQAILREALKKVLRSCRIGLVVLPAMERDQLDKEALQCLAKILRKNNLDNSRHLIYFDQAIFSSVTVAQCQSNHFKFKKKCTLCFEQDSKQVIGIQLADLAAHTCSTMLLETLGYVKKTIKAGDNSGYDEDENISLGFELWASIRYSFFYGDFEIPQNDWQRELAVKDVASYGLYIAESCDRKLEQAVNTRFGDVYLGCIHG